MTLLSCFSGLKLPFGFAFGWAFVRYINGGQHPSASRPQSPGRAQSAGSGGSGAGGRTELSERY